MSHIAKIEIEINDLSALKAACVRLGLEFICDQRTYAWFGEHIGDYPIPEGFTVDDMGKCDHAIRVPGAAYEIGVIKRDRQWMLVWDFWRSGGLERVLGKSAGKLKQAYAASKAVMEARRKGYLVKEQVTKNGGIRITLSGGRA